jgi:hypothetical protein
METLHDALQSKDIANEVPPSLIPTHQMVCNGKVVKASDFESFGECLENRIIVTSFVKRFPCSHVQTCRRIGLYCCHNNIALIPQLISHDR